MLGIYTDKGCRFGDVIDITETKGKPMTSELKCPFCLQELKKNESGAYYCTTKWCDLWGVIISRCAAEHFTQTTQDMLNTAKKLATTEKDLEIARKALEKLICEYNHCRDEEFEGADIDWEWWAMAAKNVVETALKQIEHKE